MYVHCMLMAFSMLCFFTSNFISFIFKKIYPEKTLANFNRHNGRQVVNENNTDKLWMM